MGDQSRKVKNPLLTAAGQGFPFDDFGVNTMLMPPQPSAPNEPPQIDLHDNQQGELISSNQQLLQQSEPNIQPHLPEILQGNEAKTATIDQQRSGYLTTFLSSLPNFSLKGQQQTQINQTIDDSANNQTFNFQQEWQAPQQFAPQVNFNDQLRSSSQPLVPPPTASTCPPSSSEYQVPHQQFIPPVNFNDQSRPSAQPLVPPPTASTCPPPSSGGVSYRLGNQRRLKYAPPPDLTSTPSKPYGQSIAVSNQSNQQVDFFNPTYAPGIPENPGFPPLIPSNPPTPSVSQPQEIPTSAFNDPVTPHNTPANYFSNSQLFEANYQKPQTINDLSQLASSLTLDDVPAQTVDSSRATSLAGTSEDLADIDLSQRSSPPEIFQPPPAFDTSPPTLTDFPIPPVEAKPYFSNFPATSEPTLTSFFDSTASASNPQSSVISSSVSQPLIPPVSFYNPGEFASTPQNFSLQSDINPQNLLNNEAISSVDGNNWPTLVASEMPEPTGTATLNPIQSSVNPLILRNTQQTDTIPPSLHNLASGATANNFGDRKMQYRPVYHHWFYRRNVENKILWNPFTMQDSLNLEAAHDSSDISIETKVPTDGGRYDVDILKRERRPVYWIGESTEVRRSSWFYKGPSESRYTPYEESTAARLEEEYKQACTSDHWNRKIELSNGEYIVFHSSTILIHYLQASSPELVASWGNSTGSENNSTYLQGASSRPKVVKRGVDEFHIEEGEPEKIDHLLFLVHGIGSVCDLKFRSVEEVVDEFRSISLQLIQSHYRTASTHGIVNRIEVLPISWHATLHSDDTGIDKKLKAITLESIPKLRHFANDTLLDVLFYTSPIYCQTIMQTVGNEMNRLYSLFRDRNPEFTGNVCLGGHSLGSLILFDLLCHQKPPPEDKKDDEDDTINEEDETNDEDKDPSVNSTIKPMQRSMLKRRLSRKISYVMGAAGTGQPFIIYPHLNFSPKAFFALGSPIGMFVTVRGIDKLGENFKLPTCPAFFNIFHPFDPVAYRIESLINSEAHKYRPMLIPHHKGRKRMHLELKETMARVGADLKQKLLDSVRSTWNSVYQLAMFHRSDNQALEHEIDKVVEEQLQKSTNNNNSIDNENYDEREDEKYGQLKVGQLNGGRRIDYVLQEAPFEYINEYIFALTSHVCYWESEDTMLLILKEMYGTSGIQADAQLPPQTMSIERPTTTTPTLLSTPGPSLSVSLSNSGTTTPKIGVDPTAPITNKPVGPPPTSGFVRK